MGKRRKCRSAKADRPHAASTTTSPKNIDTTIDVQEKSSPDDKLSTEQGQFDKKKNITPDEKRLYTDTESADKLQRERTDSPFVSERSDSSQDQALQTHNRNGMKKQQEHIEANRDSNNVCNSAKNTTIEEKVDIEPTPSKRKRKRKKQKSTTQDETLLQNETSESVTETAGSPYDQENKTRQGPFASSQKSDVNNADSIQDNIEHNTIEENVESNSNPSKRKKKRKKKKSATQSEILLDQVTPACMDLLPFSERAEPFSLTDKTQQEKINNLGRLNKDLIETLEKNDKVQKDIRSENQQLKKKIEDLELERNDLLSISEQLRNENELMHQDNQRKMSDYTRHINQLSTIKSKLESQVKDLTVEKTGLMDRISKMASTQLSFGNPNIADLSDPNRPTKLAETFSSLYDDEWSEAFELLSKDDGDDESKESTHIEYLLNIFMQCSKFCSKLADTQLNKLKNTLLKPTFTDDHSDYSENQIEILQLSREIIDMRKSQVSVPVHVTQMFEKANPDLSTYKKVIRDYIGQCITVCWYAAIQNPPIVFLANIKNGDLINEKYFRPYTRSGSVTEFLVWPAMLIHDDGPILSRGVAQPKPKEK